MAFEFVCRLMWNPYMLTFMDSYCKLFPELLYAQDIKRRLARLVQHAQADNIFKNEDKDVSIREISIRDVRDAKDIRDIKEEKKRPNYKQIGEMFLNSFKPFHDRIKKCDETIFPDKRCEFARYLELNSKWWPKPGTDKTELVKQDKEDIWHYFNGGYLILEIFVHTPETVIRDLEGLIQDHYNRIVREKKEFDKDKFKKSAYDVLDKLETKNLTTLTKYIRDYIVSPYTPIYDLLPPTYHNKIHTFCSIIKSESGQRFFMSQFAPLMERVKKKVPDSMIEIDDEGNVKYGDELKDNNPENIEKRKKERQRLLMGIVDVLAEVIDENKDNLARLSEDPDKGITSILSGVINAVGSMSAVGRTLSLEEEKKENYKNERLFGSSAITSSSPSTTSSSPSTSSTSSSTMSSSTSTMSSSTTSTSSTNTAPAKTAPIISRPSYSREEFKKRY